MLDRPLTLLSVTLVAASAVAAVALLGDPPVVGAAPALGAGSAVLLPASTRIPVPTAPTAQVGPLTMTVRAERSVLGLEESDSRSMIGIQADDAVGDAVQRPVALAIVVDVSGSMAGTKIEDARAGAARLVERLGDDDLLSIVSFESAAHTVLEPSRLGEARIPASAAVEQLTPLGGTCMSCGLDVAYQLLEEAPTTHDRRVVLFSDGHANEGISAPEGLAAIVATARTAHTIASTTVGLGGAYDAPLLNLLAERGTGSHLFSPGPGAIVRMRGVVARNVVLELVPAAGVRIGAVDGASEPDPDGTVRLELGSLSAEDRRRVLVPLSVGPGPARDVISARLIADAGSSPPAALHLGRSADPSVVKASLDPESAGYFAAIAASDARSAAMEMAAERDKEGAESTLKLALADLTEVHELTGLEELEVELDEVTKTLEGLEQWTGEELRAMVNNTAACNLEVRRGVKAEGRWNTAELLDEHVGY
ncbi:MAG: VWA domain-containing protein [Proteobacteria bacterium]|nr:VWA domain-containing protein [Pseudomonadota bacterium]